MNKSTVVAIDIAKTIFHAVVFGRSGNIETRKKIKRAGLLKFIAKHPQSTIVMEACATSHYWGRQFRELGHKAVLLPPQHVKAYLRGQKNDYNDAQAIGEAWLHGAIRPVRIKSVEQQDDQSFHRLRKQWVQTRGDIVRQLRGLLGEYGIVLPKGLAKFKQSIPEILEDAENGISYRLRALVARQYDRLLEVEAECDWYDQQLKQQAKEDEVCQRVIEVPGFGEVNSSAFKTWIGDGLQFKKGRDASSALGVVPRQHTSGDKQRLMSVTKRGDKALRALLVHGARSVVSRAQHKDDRLSLWINNLVARRGFNKAVVAYANKMVRIAWAIIVRNERYRPDAMIPAGAGSCH